MKNNKGSKTVKSSSAPKKTSSSPKKTVQKKSNVSSKKVLHKGAISDQVL